jgi:hypothetical protein
MLSLSMDGPGSGWSCGIGLTQSAHCPCIRRNKMGKRRRLTDSTSDDKAYQPDASEEESEESPRAAARRSARKRDNDAGDKKARRKANERPKVCRDAHPA